MHNWVRWLYPGLRLKRWLVLFSLGVLLTGGGLAMALDWRIYFWAASSLQMFIYQGTGRYFPLPVQGLAIALAGLAVMAVAVERVVRWILDALVPENGGPQAVAQMLVERRALTRGPKVVAIGGGTGLPVLLRGLKQYTSNITAVVTVADDGGSSGILRGEFGILPPGDMRNCLVALAETEGLMQELFQYRFGQGTGLAGHSFGNLFILAMSSVSGDFLEALRRSSQVLAVRGRVLPSTVEQVVLEAELADGRRVRGESQIGRAGARIRRVRLVPDDVQPLDEVLAAIREADLIVLGPGSLYTSVIPNLLVPGVAAALRRSRSPKVYVCNVMTQPGETSGYSCGDHVQALLDHGGSGVIDYCLANSSALSDELLARYRERGAEPVRAGKAGWIAPGVQLVTAPLLDQGDVARHDPPLLGAAIMRLLLGRERWSRRFPWEWMLWRERLEHTEHGGQG